MVIQHNITAINSSRQLGITAKGFADKTEKLSSGYRINRSADDAAGLSISEKMRRQIRGLSMASQNAQEGISYVQSAEGALNEVHSLLQRGNELCIKAGNDTNTDVDREAIQEEIDQIRTEIDRISRDTAFNDMDIFDSTNASDELSLSSANLMDEIKVMTPDMVQFNALNYTDSANVANAQGLTFINATNLETFANNLKDTYLPTILNHIQGALPSAQPPFDGLEIGLKFYYEDSGTLAYVGSNGVGYELGINMRHLQDDSGEIKIDGDMATTIAHELMHGIMFDTVTNGMLGSAGGDAFPGWFVEGMAQAVGGSLNYCSEAYGYLNDDKKLSEWLGELTDGGYASYAQGYIASMYLGYVAGGGTLDSASIANGLDNILSDIEDGYSLGQAIYKNTNGKYQDIADFEESFAKDAVQFTKDLFTACGSDGCGSIIMSSLSDEKETILTGSSSTTGNFFTLNLNPGEYIDNSSKYTANGVDPYTGGGATTTSGKRADGTINPDAEKIWGGMSVSGVAKASTDLVFVQVGSEAGEHININKWKMSAKDLGVHDVKVDDSDNAGKGIDKFKAAIGSVSSMRSYYGAVQNRLEHTVLNLDNAVENVTASESRIRDTDMAKMMVDYSKDNILMQAGQAMLAQANRSNQGVLSLLG